jgi:hypothetical protein
MTVTPFRFENFASLSLIETSSHCFQFCLLVCSAVKCAAVVLTACTRGSCLSLGSNVASTARTFSPSQTLPFIREGRLAVARHRLTCYRGLRFGLSYGVGFIHLARRIPRFLYGATPFARRDTLPITLQFRYFLFAALFLVQAQRHFKNKRLSDANDRKWRSRASFCVRLAALCSCMCMTWHKHIYAHVDISEEGLTGGTARKRREARRGVVWTISCWQTTGHISLHSLASH